MFLPLPLFVRRFKCVDSVAYRPVANGGGVGQLRIKGEEMGPLGRFNFVLSPTPDGEDTKLILEDDEDFSPATFDLS